VTVRTWLTISALALLALGIAVAVRFTSQPDPPPILARAGEVRLEGTMEAACWPDRGNEVRCREGSDEARPPARAIPPAGSIRLIVAFPVQPERGQIRILRDGDVVNEGGWTERVAYDLEPGRYELVAEARYEQSTYVRWRFPFAVARS
jgi:hypothetical protein